MFVFHVGVCKHDKFTCSEHSLTMRGHGEVEKKKVEEDISERWAAAMLTSGLEVALLTFQE